MLENSQSFDVEFLGLNPLDPSENRDATQEAEDTICRRLLLLGAKWWHSEERHFYVKRLKEVAAGYSNAASRSDHEGETVGESRVAIDWRAVGLRIRYDLGWF